MPDPRGTARAGSGRARLTWRTPLLPGSVTLPLPVPASSMDFRGAELSCFPFSSPLSALQLPDFKPPLPIIRLIAVLAFIFRRLYKPNEALQNSDPFQREGRVFRQLESSAGCAGLPLPAGLRGAEGRESRCGTRPGAGTGPVRGHGPCRFREFECRGSGPSLPGFPDGARGRWRQGAVSPRVTAPWCHRPAGAVPALRRRVPSRVSGGASRAQGGVGGRNGAPGAREESAGPAQCCLLRV